MMLMAVSFSRWCQAIPILIAALTIGLLVYTPRQTLPNVFTLFTGWRKEKFTFFFSVLFFIVLVRLMLSNEILYCFPQNVIFVMLFVDIWKVIFYYLSLVLFNFSSFFLYQSMIPGIWNKYANCWVLRHQKAFSVVTHFYEEWQKKVFHIFLSNVICRITHAFWCEKWYWLQVTLTLTG